MNTNSSESSKDYAQRMEEHRKHVDTQRGKLDLALTRILITVAGAGFAFSLGYIGVLNTNLGVCTEVLSSKNCLLLAWLFWGLCIFYTIVGATYSLHLHNQAVSEDLNEKESCAIKKVWTKLLIDWNSSIAAGLLAIGFIFFAIFVYSTFTN